MGLYYNSASLFKISLLFLMKFHVYHLQHFVSEPIKKEHILFV